MNKTTKQLAAQRRRQRKKDAKKEAVASMVFEGPGPAHAIKVLSDAPANTSDWDAVIHKALDEVRISQKEIDQRERILGLVEQTLKPHYPRTICKLFGSSETRLGFKDSNTDIHLSIGYDPYNNTTKKEGREKASKLVRQIADCFKGHPELTLVGTHVGGRSPLVKVSHVASRTRVDLSLCNVFAVANSSLVRLLCDSHPQVRPFMLFLRLWAITQEIAGRGRPKFRLTNYVLTRIAIFTCMAREQRLVPSLDDLRKQPYDTNMIEGWECGHGTDVTAYWKQQEKEQPKNIEGGVLALALEFFEMYAGLDCFRWAVCPLVGKLVDRRIFRSAAAAAQAAAGGPKFDSDTDGEEAAADDDNDSVTVTDNGADKAMITDNGADKAMITDNGADKAMITDNGADKARITDNGADKAMITDNGADKAMITDNGAEKAMITDNGDDKAMITDNGVDSAMLTDDVAGKALITGSVADKAVVTDIGVDDCMITDKSVDDTKNTDKGVDDTMIIDMDADDMMITDKGVDDTIITDKGADDSMITDNGVDDAMITDKGTDNMITDKGTDNMISRNDPENIMITDKAGDYTIVTDKSSDDNMMTEFVRTAAAVTTTDAVATAAAGTTTDAVATDAASTTTDAVAKAAVTTTDSVATDAAVTTTDAVAADATVTSNPTVAAILTDAVVEKDKIMSDSAVEGATHVTDIVTEDARGAIANSTCATNHISATNASNAATASNNVSSTVIDSASDSCNSSLPEALLPHFAKIAKRHRNTPLCVMDLFALDTNFTYQYHLLNVRSFQEKCRKSAEIIKEVLKGEKSLAALFTKIEVSS